MNLSIRTKTRLTILLFLIKTWITISTCSNNSVLIGLPNTEAAASGARIVLNKSLKIRSFCARINFSRVSGNQLAFFSKSKSNNFSVLFKHNANYGFIALNSIRNYFDILEKPTPFTFQHFCFSHNVTNYLVASEGKIWHSHKFEQSDIETVDALTYIKDLSFGPTHNPNDARISPFVGIISELNIFSNTFSETDLIAITGSCKKIEIGDKEFSWSEIYPSDLIRSNGEIKVEVNNVEDICSVRRTRNLEIIPISSSLEDAIMNCQVLGLDILLPKANQFKELNRRAKEDEVMENLVDNSCKKSFWLPLRKSPDLSGWVDPMNMSKEVQPGFEVFRDGSERQLCAYYYMNNGESHDIPCSSKSCAACVQKLRLSFSLKGLCSTSTIDQNYVLINRFHHNGLFGKQNTYSIVFQCLIIDVTF